ncbi:MAG: Uma2 family endonuclease [Isosphaeraceae bacterium]
MATADIATKPEVGTASPTDHRYLLTIKKYYGLIRAGGFSEDDPIYLWKGQLVEKMTINPPHASTVFKVSRLLHRALPDGWLARPEQPLEIGQRSVPEPDVAIVRGALDAYDRRHPQARDVALLIEVSDSSLAEDQGDKLQTYAAAGVPVYWIVNLPNRRIEVYTEPAGPVTPSYYRKSQFFGPGDEVPIVLDGVEVGRLAVTDVLPQS